MRLAVKLCLMGYVRLSYSMLAESSGCSLLLHASPTLVLALVHVQAQMPPF